MSNILDKLYPKKEIIRTTIVKEPLYKELNPDSSNAPYKEPQLSEEIYTQTKEEGKVGKFSSSKRSLNKKSTKQFIQESIDNNQSLPNSPVDVSQPANESTGVKKAYRDTINASDRFYRERVLSPVLSLRDNPRSPFYVEGRGQYDKYDPSYREVNLKGTGEFMRGVRDKIVYEPTETLVIYGIGKGVGKFVSASPGLTSALSSPKGKVLGGGLLGVYSVGVAQKVSSSDNPGYTLGSEAINFAAFSKGSLDGFKFNPKTITRVKSKPVNTIEYFKTTTRSKDFGGNIIDYYRGKPDMFSGGQKSSGGGLFQVGNKKFRILFKEKGLTRDIEGARLTRSTSTLNVQPYEYILNSRVPSGTLKKVRFTSEQVSLSGVNDVTNIRGIAKIKGQGTPQITRLTSAKSISDGDMTKVSGFNVDMFRNRKIPDSLKQIKGFSQSVFKASKNDIQYDISKGNMFGRSLDNRNAAFKKDYLSDIKSFNRNEFISGSNSLIGEQKVVQQPSSLISENVLKDVALNQYKVSVAQSNANFLKYSPKPILSSNRQSIITKSSYNAKSKNIYSTEPMLKLKTKQNTNFISKVGFNPITISKQSSNQFSISRTRQQPTFKQNNMPMLDLHQNIVQKQSQKLKQSTLQKQSTFTKQTRISRGFLNISPISNMFGFPFKERKWSFGKLIEPKSISKSNNKRSLYYIPSIEANIFGKSAKKEDINFSIARTGLSLRPFIK